MITDDATPRFRAHADRVARIQAGESTCDQMGIDHPRCERPTCTRCHAAISVQLTPPDPAWVEDRARRAAERAEARRGRRLACAWDESMPDDHEAVAPAVEVAP